MNGDEIMHLDNTYFEYQYYEEDAETDIRFKGVPDPIMGGAGELIFTISDEDTSKTLSTVRFGYDMPVD